MVATPFMFSSLVHIFVLCVYFLVYCMPAGTQPGIWLAGLAGTLVV